ncbi:hypothetical protein [Yersinia phage MHG19]|nr:hypothetical protein [Yersinia phage MHG19]
MISQERMDYLMVGQFAPKKRTAEECREIARQTRGTQIGIAPAAEVVVNQDPTYHAKGFKL